MIRNVGKKIDSNEIGEIRAPFVRKNLTPPDNLKSIFKNIRNHLAGMTSGITRDETFAYEMTKILFCKIFDEKTTENNETVQFYVIKNESTQSFVRRISNLFSNVIENNPESFKKKTKIELDESSLRYIVNSLQRFCVTEADRDALGDVLEVFIGPALRGNEGQFFTPKNAVEMMVKIIDPKPGESIIDPACGAGGFLTVCLNSIWSKLDNRSKKEKWAQSELNKHKTVSASKLFGIDKDHFQATVTRASMSLLGDGSSNIFCDNSLRNFFLDKDGMSEYVKTEKFDVVLTNPPFGSKIQIVGPDILSQYDLAKVWKVDKTGQWVKNKKLLKKQAPQILFIERCLQLLKPGGRMGIILPETLFGNPSHRYIIEYIKQNTKFLGLVSFPDELFQPHTHSKTCALFVEKTRTTKDYEFFMGTADWCGHDSRGNKIPYDDLPKISEEFYAYKNHNHINHLSFAKKISSIKNNIFIPKYYDPDTQKELNKLEKTHDIVTIQSLIERNIISISTGVEVGKLNYGTGSFPFIRTSDMVNWEIKLDPKHGVNQIIYDKFKKKCDLQLNDILMVRDGTYLVGTTVMITKHDLECLFQSHISKIRSLKPESFSPYLLIALLNSEIVKKQILSKRFTQEIIDTLGKRILEIQIPIPKDEKTRTNITKEVKNIITTRSDLRQKTKDLCKKLAR